MYESKAVTNTFGNAQRFMSRTATPLKQEPNTCTCIRPIFNEKKRQQIIPILSLTNSQMQYM